MSTRLFTNIPNVDNKAHVYTNFRKSPLCSSLNVAKRENLALALGDSGTEANNAVAVST
jgi:hypothetical protein